MLFHITVENVILTSEKSFVSYVIQHCCSSCALGYSQPNITKVKPSSNYLFTYLRSQGSQKKIRKSRKAQQGNSYQPTVRLSQTIRDVE